MTTPAAAGPQDPASLAPVTLPTPAPVTPERGAARRPGVVRVLCCLVPGVVVGVVGTGVHRAYQPWGLVLGYLTVVSAAVLARAWVRGRGTLAFGTGLLATLVAAAYLTPGGDVIIAGDGIGYAWIAAPVLVAVAALLPRRLFSDRPLVRRRDEGAPS